MAAPPSLQQILDAAGLTFFERGWLSSNNMLFCGRERSESVLVDSGYYSHQDQTVELVRRALGTPALDRIVNTHLHSDHCGGNQALQVAFGSRVDIPVGEVEKVDAWDEARLTYRDSGQRCPRFIRHGAIRADTDIQLGDRDWRVIAAPGHDPESVVLYQPDLRLLISADALWENGFGVVFPEIEGKRAFDDVRDTLDRIATLEVDWVLPGHGAPFTGAQPAIERAVRRLDGFVADPARHAHHAAKVLVKFHLLDAQAMPWASLLAWMMATPYLRRLHQAHFADLPLGSWCEALILELRDMSAARIEAGVVRNH